MLVVMLAYLIRRELSRTWASLDITVEEGLHQLQTLSSIEMKVEGGGSCLRIPTPSTGATAPLQALKIQMPEALPHTNTPVTANFTIKPKHLPIVPARPWSTLELRTMSSLHKLESNRKSRRAVKNLLLLRKAKMRNEPIFETQPDKMKPLVPFAKRTQFPISGHVTLPAPSRQPTWWGGPPSLLWPRRPRNAERTQFGPTPTASVR